MSYKQAIRWQMKHPKGTRQPVLMSTGSGFWPARAWLEDSWWPYVGACKALGVKPIEMEAFYTATLGSGHFQRTPEVYAAMTQAGTLAP